VSGDALGRSSPTSTAPTWPRSPAKPRTEVVAGASRDPAGGSAFEARTGRPTYIDWREMLAREKFDIVSVATYAPHHAEVTIACALAALA